MKDPKRFYTYAYLREDRTPYYIGKGEGRRAYLQLNHKVKTPPKDRILILKDKLLENESFNHEEYMIAVLGRKDLGTGILRNRTNGGAGGISGFKHSEETKNKMRKPNTDEHNKKVSEAIKRKWENGEYNKEEWKKRNLGKKHSEETKKKTSMSLKKYYEENEKIISDETRKKMVASWKEKYKNGEIKKPTPSPNFSGRWWNNGQKNKRMVECPGTEWMPGKL
jgi:hypothetical protein